MKRTIVIGDIHGGYKALIQVLERANVTKKDKIIFLGDYVDGWSETCQLIDFLIQLKSTHNCEFLIGNHDFWHIEWLNHGATHDNWLRNGGVETIKSYNNVSDEKKKNHLLFLQQMKGYIIDESNRLFVHAGFTNIYGVDKEKLKDNFSWDRTLWEMVLCIDRSLTFESSNFPRRLKLYKEIFIGHNATTEHGTDQPINIYNLWNIDTGAGFNGRLTALDVDTKQYWQSDLLMHLYPNEKGRRK